MTSRIAAFVARRWSVPESCIDVELQPIGSGLESVVTRARVTTRGSDSRIPQDVVVKQLSEECRREADIYLALWQHLLKPPAVQMFGRHVSADATYIYLEHASAFSSWPWSDSASAARVCRQLGYLHDSENLPHAAFSWNYEDQLMRSAEETLEVAAVARDASGRLVWRRLGDLRRVIRGLPAIRRLLLAGGETVIHGDVHPGNVVLRRAATGVDVLLIDWARARVGSPLEDITSWLHSLGCWEPQARRRHDTLMRAYLESRRAARIFGPDVRVAYWFASVSNGLSGAIRYHVAVLADPSAPQTSRTHSGLALIAWHRVVRRAAALMASPVHWHP